MFKKWFSKKDKIVKSGISYTLPPDPNAGTWPPKITTISPPAYTIANSVYVGYANTITSISPTLTGYASSLTTGANFHNSGPAVLTLYNNSHCEIVRLDTDGTITWANGINVGEAAEAFGRVISLSAEIKSGITQGVKHRMRDSVFADLIDIAKEKGSLTADDLTYLLEASKIVEKLKGGKE